MDRIGANFGFFDIHPVANDLKKKFEGTPFEDIKNFRKKVSQSRNNAQKVLGDVIAVSLVEQNDRY